jgi:hypothetical protein
MRMERIRDVRLFSISQDEEGGTLQIGIFGCTWTRLDACC